MSDLNDVRLSVANWLDRTYGRMNLRTDDQPTIRSHNAAVKAVDLVIDALRDDPELAAKALGGVYVIDESYADGIPRCYIRVAPVAVTE